MDEQVVQKIKQCELLLIGLGEELDLTTSKSFRQQVDAVELSDEDLWMLPYLKRNMLKKEIKERLALYNQLAQGLQDKNYFVVSLALDGAVGKSELNQERVVEPCGGFDKWQCCEKCAPELWDVDDALCENMEAYLAGKGDIQKPKEPVCPHCGKPLVFNNVECGNYAEEGYLEHWQIYTKWLQGTVNKKVCILEIGTGMKYPTVIRWPFEKIAFFNQKADFIRVHSKLYQTAEEIKEKSQGICQRPEDFLRELSNAL